MSVYLESIISGIIIFPIIAAIFTIPYVISQYRKYGAMIILRVSIVYSLILYLICAYFMVLLPLPSEDIPRLSQTTQLIPFKFIQQFHQIILNKGSIINILKAPVIYQAIFNLLLTLPLGIYLRYYFNRKWYHVLIIGFLMSLSFELLQLTGIMGIYQYPYRIFDVDDLIINTLGTMFGFWLTPLMTMFLPSKDKLKQLSYLKGTNVSFSRRLVAFIIDNIIMMSCLYLFNKLISNHYQIFIDYLLVVLLYYGLVNYLFKGQTIGKMVVKIKLVNQRNQRPTLIQCIKRYGLLYLMGTIVPYLAYQTICLFVETTKSIRYLALLEALVLMFFFVYFIFSVVMMMIFSHQVILYEEFSQLDNESVIKNHDIIE